MLLPRFASISGAGLRCYETRNRDCQMSDSHICGWLMGRDGAVAQRESVEESMGGGARSGPPPCICARRSMRRPQGWLIVQSPLPLQETFGHDPQDAQPHAVNVQKQFSRAVAWLGVTADANTAATIT